MVAFMMALLLCSVATAKIATVPITILYDKSTATGEAESISEFAAKYGYQVISIPYSTRGTTKAEYEANTKAFAAQKEAAVGRGGVIVISVENGPIKSIKPSIIDQFIVREKSSRDIFKLLRNDTGIMSKADVYAVFLSVDDMNYCGLPGPNPNYTWGDLAAIIEQLTACRQLPHNIPDRSGVYRLLSLLMDTLNLNYVTDEWVHSNEFKWALSIIDGILSNGIGSISDVSGFLGRAIGPPLPDGTPAIPENRTPYMFNYIGNIPSLFSSSSPNATYNGPLDWIVLPLPKGPNGLRPRGLLNIQSWTVEEGPYATYAWEFMRWIMIGEGRQFFLNSYPYSLTAPLLAGYKPAIHSDLVQKGIMDALNAAHQMQTESYKTAVQLSTRSYYEWDPAFIITDSVLEYITEDIAIDNAIARMAQALVDKRYELEKMKENQ